MFAAFGKTDFGDICMRWGNYLLCIGCGVLLFFAAELADKKDSIVENGGLKRNSCGQGEAVHEFYVEGLEEKEVEMAKEAGLHICTLGSRILRCETAPLCALSAVMYATGEF